MKTILIQGAMDCEIDEFIEFYKPTQNEIIGGFKFWICEYLNSKIIISKTDVGIINATTATTIAILKYKPDLDKSTTKISQKMTIDFVDLFLKQNN